MSLATIAVEIPQFLQHAAERLASEDGVSLSHWISLAVAQKIGAVEAASDFFRQRARGAEQVDIQAILAKAGNEPPVTGDKLPDDLREKFMKRS